MIPLFLAVSCTAQASESAFDHSHAALGTFLAGAVSGAGVDYATLASRRAALDDYVEQIQQVDASGFDAPQKLALYVNAYNAYTLQTMLDTGPPASITDLDGGKVWDTRGFVVAGEELTLNQMEHDRARKLADGRIHAAVNCASKGCPPLPPTPMTSSNVGSHLTAGARRWASTNAFTLTGDTIALSQIFDWYAQDFPAVPDVDIPQVEGNAENALHFLARYVDEETKNKLLSGSLTATWQDYDWSLNQR